MWDVATLRGVSWSCVRAGVQSAVATVRFVLTMAARHDVEDSMLARELRQLGARAAAAIERAGEQSLFFRTRGANAHVHDAVVG